MTDDELSYKIIGAILEVHAVLGGPGLLESVYEAALEKELLSRGLDVKRQVQVPIVYKGDVVGDPLRLDLFVNDRIIIELKAVTEMHDVFKSQLLTYLRVMNLRLGLLVNFGVPYVKDGITRVLNNRFNEC